MGCRTMQSAPVTLDSLAKDIARDLRTDFEKAQTSLIGSGSDDIEAS